MIIEIIVQIVSPFLGIDVTSELISELNHEAYDCSRQGMKSSNE